MKNRPVPRPKPETKPDRRPASPATPKLAIDGASPSAVRKLEKIGQNIAGLRTELDRLAEERARERARERTGKPPRRP